MLVSFGVFLGILVIVFAGVMINKAINDVRADKVADKVIEKPKPVVQLTDSEKFVQLVKNAIPRNTGFIFELTPLTYDREKPGHDVLRLGDFYVEVKMIDPITKEVLRQYAPNLRTYKRTLNDPFEADYGECLIMELANGVKEVLNERATVKLKGQTEIIT